MIRPAFAFGIAGLIAACASGDIPEPDGAMAFAQDCSVCHGAGGRGDGPAAAGLARAPADLTLLTFNAAGVFPRDYIYSTIDGYDRGSHFSPDMPAFGDGDLGQTIVVENDDGTATPVPARLLALADYLETLQRTP